MENLFVKELKIIKKQLKNKNNDKNNINQNDAFFLLTGKLKIFEYINIGNIIEEIEFVDLPGANNEENDFNKKKYNTNVLTFSNCCIYVNVSSSVKDKTSVIKIKEQFKSDKDKVFLTLRPKFIKTCLFIINKSDEIEQENGKIKPSEIEKKSDELYNAIFDNNSNEILKKDDLNISFVSSKYFMEYLNVKEKYVYLLESDPHELITELNNDYISQTPSKSFLDFIRNKIGIIEKNFNLKNECRLIEKENLPEEFELNLKNILNVFGIDSNSLVISFYKLKEALKIKDFSNTKYSNDHYKKIEKIIINSSELRKENFIEYLNHYLAYTDILFNKRITENSIEVKKEKTKKDNEVHSIIENIKEILNKRRKFNKYYKEK